jgi:hypothetical protein
LILRVCTSVLVLFWLIAAGALAASVRPVERPDSEVLLLAVAVEGRVLADALPAYSVSGGGVLLPLGELCRLLGVAVTVDPERGTAAGTILTAARPFSLDLGAGSVRIAGKDQPLVPGELEMHADDLYVDMRRIARWLPVDLDLDRGAAALTVRPREPFPSLVQEDRERAAGLTLAGARGGGGAAFPSIPNRYSLFGSPFLDQTVRITSEAGGAGRQTHVDYSTYLTGDLFFLESSAYLAGTGGGFSDARITLGRSDPDGQLLGPLHARQFALGDVYHPGLDLLSAGRSGTGATVSNFPLEQPTQFDRNTFRGELPPGWQLELYRGETLLDFRASAPDGRYEIADVALLAGFNAFRLVFYGPQGQRREEVRSFNVGASLAPAGRLLYRVTWLDPGLKIAGVAVAGAGARAIGELRLGLSPRWTLEATAARVSFQGAAHDYVRAGLHGFLGAVFLGADAVLTPGGGSAFQGSAQTRVAGVGISLQHAEMSRFVSERFSTTGPLLRETLLRFDATVPKSFLPALPMTLDLKRDDLAAGGSVTEVRHRLSAMGGGFALTNLLTWNFSRPASGAVSRDTSGELLVSRFAGDVSIRGGLTYTLAPEVRSTSLSLTAERRVLSEYLVSAGAQQSYAPSVTTWIVGASRLEGPFAVGAQARYSRPGGLAISAVFTVGLAYDKSSGKLHMQAASVASNGGVSARAFVDENGNGRFDPGERLIEGALFDINASPAPVRADARGRAFIVNVPGHQWSDVSLRASSLEDPSWKPSVPGVRVASRPGKTAHVDLPVQAMGEVTGTVWSANEVSRRAVPGARVELLRPDCSVAASARSAFDGFFDISDVVPGLYTLRASATGLMENGRPVEVEANGALLEGMDLVLHGNLEGLPSPVF